MDKIRQRIVIAETCGWKDCRFIPAVRLNTGPLNVWKSSACVGIHPFDDKHDGEKGLPDYLHILDAMHEAEKSLLDSQQQPYLDWLEKICQRDCLAHHGNPWAHSATAVQRAEAFLRTLGKWEE